MNEIIIFGTPHHPESLYDDIYRASPFEFEQTSDDSHPGPLDVAEAYGYGDEAQRMHDAYINGLFQPPVFLSITDSTEEAHEEQS